MSILIKGMEMPKDGAYWCELNVAGDIAMITIHGEDRKSFHLVPVPPHGRLIDADAFLKDICDNLNEMTEIGIAVDGNWLWCKLTDALDNLPTIIPAEEGE